MKFKPEDFKMADHVIISSDIACVVANKKLQEWLDKAPTVYSLKAAYCKGFVQRWGQQDSKKFIGEAQDRAKLILMENKDE